MGIGTHVKRAAIAVALLAGLVVIDQGAPAGAVSPMLAGFNTYIAYPNHLDPNPLFDEAEMAQAVDDMTPNGVVRFVVPWMDLQPGLDGFGAQCQPLATSLTCTNPGPINWDFVDDQLQDIQAEGLKVLLVPMAAPAWNRDPFDFPSYYAGWQTITPPGDTHARLTQWQLFVVSLVQRIEARDPNLLVGVEIWNEPNGVLNWNTSLGGPQGQRYKRVLCYAYGGVKFVDPTLPVIFAGTNPNNSASSFTTFVNDAYNVGAAGCMDRLGIHPYPPAMPTTATAADHVAAYETVMNQLRAVRNAHFDNNRKISITEINTQAPGAPAPDTLIGQFLALSYASAVASTDVDMYLVSAVFDTPQFPDEGLCATPSVPKGRASAFRTAVTGLSGTASC